jgi:hypothetical protein
MGPRRRRRGRGVGSGRCNGGGEGFNGATTKASWKRAHLANTLKIADCEAFRERVPRAGQASTAAVEAAGPKCNARMTLQSARGELHGFCS